MTVLYYGLILINIFFLHSCQSRQNKVDELAKEINKRIYENDEPARIDNLYDEKCQSERTYIISQTKEINTMVANLVEKHKNLSSQAFEKYLTQWNKDIDLVRNQINNYNYKCFKYIGIKGLGTLASQIGLDYIQVVMYNDKSSLLQTKQRFEKQKRDILTSLEANL